ncbi:zinc finger protein 609-like [Electrophorus electricus]|uniref:zinc finger protein 609-like n=1 Tax=Electrophorus electricus TaxID=8005 RepID=UPI0015D06DD4|nr:zinc finger protein 609-like [Electrophorus electricus]
MSLSGGTAGGKGVDSNAVDTYDSGDEWDIGVGNLIIDLDADLEKDKLEMSGSKEAAGMAAPPSAVATLPDNIKFVSPVGAPQGKESKSKSKRNKNSKDNSSKSPAGDGAKKEHQGRTQGEVTGTTGGTGGASNATPGKGIEKGGKASRGVPNSKKEKEASAGKAKKEKNENLVAAVTIEKEVAANAQALGNSTRGASFDPAPNADLASAEMHGINALETVGIVPLAVKPEPEELDNGECRVAKKVKNEKMESPVSTPAPPPLHLLGSGVNADIASPCEQLMVRTRSVAVNTSDVASATEPECLGPCEPGTSVNLEGIVWQETEDGMLVVNVTWRNKTYVGTLLDCTRHDWAPPRFCESPTSDLEMRNGRGRGKRMRPNSNTPVNENSNSSDNKGNNNSKTRAGSNSKGRRGSQNSSERRTPPNSNVEDVKASPSSASKRKNKPASDMEPNSSSEDTKGNKRMRTNSNSGATPSGLAIPTIKTECLPPPLDRSCPSPVLIDCPYPNCNKKYKHINGLKYHQARAHNDDDIKLDMDGDSEYGEETSLHPEPGSCNGASVSQKGSLSPARSVTPKGRGFEVQSSSPSPGKFGSKPKKKNGDADTEACSIPVDGCEDGPSLTDDASNDGMEDKKSKKPTGGSIKHDKLSQKNVKSSRPMAPSITSQQMYSLQATPFSSGSPSHPLGMSSMMQGIPKSPQLKGIQPKPSTTGDVSPMNTVLGSSKDKKKKDKKKKESCKDADSPKPSGKGGKAEDGKSPYSESSDPGGRIEGHLNGSSDHHQSRLASIKAEADKIYSFTDNAPSPSIGVASRIDNCGQPLTPLHVVTQNGADSASVKTNSPAYSDISDAGEDGEGKMEGVKSKVEDHPVREGAKKALFPSQAPNKESPYYASYDNYYSPTYAHPSPGGASAGALLADSQAVKVKKEEEQESSEEKAKPEVQEERKADAAPSQPHLQSHHHHHQQQQQQQHHHHHHQQQASVIQQRSNMYMQPLYYSQYYVPPYSYPDQVYHNHLMNTNPAYRQQYEERQRLMAEQHRAAEKKADASMKEREASMKEDWKQKGPVPLGLTKAPSLSDLGKSQAPSKQRDSASEPAKSVIIPKGEEAKLQPLQAEGLKVKLSEGGHHGKEDSKTGVESVRPSMEQAVWYRQYPESQRQADEERERDRERKSKDERIRPKDAGPKDDNKDMADRPSAAAPEDYRGGGKDPRANAHLTFSSALAQQQPYMHYMHGYPYGQGYDPNHPGYRGMPSVMMQNYPGPYLPAGYPFSPYGGKMGAGEEGEKSRSSPTVSKAASEAKALDILHQHANQYKSKSPTVGEKPPHDRERVMGEREREREVDRPRSSPSQRIMASHHHLGYPLVSGQYDLSYATGLSSSAIVASQQAAASSLYPPARR